MARDRPTPIRTWRPQRLIITATVFTAIFVAGAVIGWFALPKDIRVLFNAFQILTLLGILAVMVVVMWLLAGSWVRADDDGLTFRNGWQVRTLPWHEIRRVRLRPGDPWAVAELHPTEPDVDPEVEPGRVAMLGLQGSEGATAHDAVREINARLASG